MPACVLATLALLGGSVTTAQVTRDAPSYSAASIVNAASNDPNAIAPYSIITINGANLAWDNRSMQPSDVINGNVPVVLPNAGVRVWIASQAAGILSVSPKQLTVLVPGDLISGVTSIQTMLDGLAGPEVLVNLNTAGPGIYAEPAPQVDPQADPTQPPPPQFVQASRPDGAPVTSDDPLLPGDLFVLHATGLGMSSPPLFPLQIPNDAYPLSPDYVVTIYLNGVSIDPSSLRSVTFVSGQAGLLQMLLQLPPDAPPNPEFRIDVNGAKSAPGFLLRVKPGNL
jgi:uncharacterized protein (TIGR03437 family)